MSDLVGNPEDRFSRVTAQLLQCTIDRLLAKSNMTNEPVREKTNNLGFRPGPTQTRLYSHRTLLEAGNFVFK